MTDITTTLTAKASELGAAGLALAKQALPSGAVTAAQYLANRALEARIERPLLKKDLQIAESMIVSAEGLVKHATDEGLKLCSLSQLRGTVYIIRNRIRNYLLENDVKRPSRKAKATRTEEKKTQPGRVKQVVEKASKLSNALYPLEYREQLQKDLLLFQTSFSVFTTDLNWLNSELAGVPITNTAARAAIIAKFNSECKVDTTTPFARGGGPPGGPEVLERRGPRRSDRIKSKSTSTV